MILRPPGEALTCFGAHGFRRTDRDGAGYLRPWLNQPMRQTEQAAFAQLAPQTGETPFTLRYTE